LNQARVPYLPITKGTSPFASPTNAVPMAKTSSDTRKRPIRPKRRVPTSLMRVPRRPPRVSRVTAAPNAESWSVSRLHLPTLTDRSRHSRRPNRVAEANRSEQTTDACTPFREAMWKPYSAEWAIVQMAAMLAFTLLDMVWYKHEMMTKTHHHSFGQSRYRHVDLHPAFTLGILSAGEEGAESQAWSHPRHRTVRNV
jgi:hypothetical protein